MVSLFMNLLLLSRFKRVTTPSFLTPQSNMRRGHSKHLFDISVSCLVCFRFFKALHNVLERNMLRCGYLRFGRWFTRPLDDFTVSSDCALPSYAHGMRFEFSVQVVIVNLFALARIAGRKPRLCYHQNSVSTSNPSTYSKALRFGFKTPAGYFGTLVHSCSFITSTTTERCLTIENNSNKCF